MEGVFPPATFPKLKLKTSFSNNEGKEVKNGVLSIELNLRPFRGLINLFILDR